MPWFPKRLASRWFGRFARLHFRRELRMWLLGLFIKIYDIDMSEAEFPLKKYKTLDELFTRRFRKGARTIQSDFWIHPVDGVVTAAGRVKGNQAFQIKGWNYPLNTLLGHQTYAFDGGIFLTYYLCPTDYHRVHSPCTGDLVSVKHMQGQLWPVNDWSVNHIKNLFCENERIAFNYHTEYGDVAIVMVGATNVGDIEVSSDHTFRTNLAKKTQAHVRNYNPPIDVRIGQEIGIFHMGSTVIVLASPEFAKHLKKIPKGLVKLGEPVIV
jgi:phosphatidylserine decarboxylase